MEDCLYDTSWTIHALSQMSAAAITALCAKLPAKQLKDYLSSTTEKRALYENEQPDVEKTGDLQDITFRHWETGSFYCITHERAISKFVLYGSSPPRLLLTRAAAPIVHKFTSYLFDTFSISTVPVKLPSTLLYDLLKSYMATITTAQQSAEATLSKATLSALRITFSFLPPVAPKLRSIDVDINIPNASLTTQAANQTIINSINAHIERATGAFTLSLKPKEEHDKEATRMSKVSCAAFALSVEGKLKFTLKAVESAVQFEDIARKANKDILDAIVVEVRKQGMNG